MLVSLSNPLGLNSIPMLAFSFVLIEKYAHLSREWKHSIFISEAYEQEHATPLYFCHGVFIDQFIFRSNLLWMRLPWECRNQSQDTNWRHCVLGPELRFFFKRKGILKIDQSAKMPWHGSCKLLLIGWKVEWRWIPWTVARQPSIRSYIHGVLDVIPPFWWQVARYERWSSLKQLFARGAHSCRLVSYR